MCVTDDSYSKPASFQGIPLFVRSIFKRKFTGGLRVYFTKGRCLILNVLNILF